MSEKRFVIDEKTNYKDYPIILDTKTGDWWVIQDTMMGTEKLLDLLNEQQAEIGRLKKELEPKFEDNQETEIRECQFCGEFRTEYHEYEDYSWSAEDYCNAGHYLEDTDPNTCKDYWDND